MRYFGGYKILKEQQKVYFKKLIKRDLGDFWIKFNIPNTDKIELLKIYANKKYNYTPSISKTRQEFNGNLRFKKWIYANCYICGQSPTIAHHIIQLQNGGMNIKKNIIRICRDCHSKIHPWLSSTELSKETELEKERIESADTNISHKHG